VTRAGAFLCLLVLVASVLTVTAKGGRGATSSTPTPSHGAHSASATTLLEQRLKRQYLSYHWVICVRMDRHYQGHQLWRCNVDFGDPHIVQYCAIVVRNRLVTDRENRALNCAPVQRHAR